LGKASVNVEDSVLQVIEILGKLLVEAAGVEAETWLDPLNPVKFNIYDNIVFLSGCFESVKIRHVSLEFVSFGESLGKVRGGLL
jgi:hypothetical protein